jgi:aspartate/methionine/tyrosine aminotransferase
LALESSRGEGDRGGVRRFPPSPITALVDEAPRYNLGESTCRDLTVEELLGPQNTAQLARLSLGYGTSTGQHELRKLIADNVGVDADEILVTSGAAPALFLLALLFGDDDAEIVVAEPCFPPMLAALRGIGARVVKVRFGFESSYRLDPEALTRVLTSDTRLVMLASPSNPAGVALTRDEIELALATMAEVCPGALLLVDETYREAVYGAGPALESFASLSPQVVTCSSLSKAHGAPGLRIGWLTARNPDLHEQLRLARFNLAVSCGTVDEHLAAELLRRADTVLRSRRDFLAEALATVENWVAGHADRVRWVRPDAGAFCCIQLDPDAFGTAGVQRFHARLAERRTLVAPGPWFGDSEYVFRLGFGYEPMDKLEVGLDMVGEALQP